MSKILVTGATGGLGQAVLENLLRTTAPDQLVALARDPAKAAGLAAQGVQVRQGDYDDPTALQAAFAGIDKVLLVSGTDENRLAQHANVINAAQAAGVRHVVYTSIPRQTPGGSPELGFITDSHIGTERLLAESGLTYTILRNTLYLDVLPMFMGKVLETGTIYLPAGQGRVPYASRADLGAAAAAVLTGTGHANQAYDLTGPRAYSFADLAALLTELAGKPIAYVSPTAEEFGTRMAGAGLPAHVIELLVGFCSAIAQGELAAVSPVLGQLLGHEPESARAFLQQAYGL